MNIKTNYASASQAIAELDAVGKNIDDFFPSSNELVSEVKQYNSIYFGNYKSQKGSLKEALKDVVEKTENYCKTSNKYIADLMNMNNKKTTIADVTFSGSTDFSGVPFVNYSDKAEELRESGKMSEMGYAATVDLMKKATALLEAG
ncbi:MAG: hypothetical protein IJI60_02860, partial [Bacilli bacterium]|nr:hypothetical protein [Bacilli bacterium]